MAGFKKISKELQDEFFEQQKQLLKMDQEFQVERENKLINKFEEETKKIMEFTYTTLGIFSSDNTTAYEQYIIEEVEESD